MSICDNCIHLKVCGHENVEDEAMTYCADKEERPNEYEWCKGCKEHDEENHCCHRLSNFIHTQAQEIHDMAYEECKNDVIHSIAEQYSAHNEIIPLWLSIGDLRGGAE